MARTGVLPSQVLKTLMDGEFIAGIEHKFINPASLDLPLGQEAYRLEKVFLPLRGQKVRSLLPLVGATPHDLTNPLEVGVPYLVQVKGRFKLPEGIYGYANPKSSTGRINLFARTVADCVSMYDSLGKPGWEGELWMLVRPDSFPILLAPDKALSQMRFFDGKGFLSDLELQGAINRHALLYHEDGTKCRPDEYERHADSFFLSAGVPDGIVGWECRGVQKVLDIRKENCYQPEQFFEPIEGHRGLLTLRKGSFYILTTKQFVRVPPEYSAELRATDQRIVNARVHAAGYIDPGWGWGKSGEVHGRPITLEVTVNEDNVLLQDGQNVARIRYEWMREIPEKLYDEVGSNYTTQSAAKLSKHFMKGLPSKASAA